MGANKPEQDPIETICLHGQKNGSTPAHEQTLQLPELIGRYRIQRVLGRGGFGVVYLAQDDQLGRPVAVKVPHTNLVGRPGNAELYLAEARAVAKLEHPNIVPVYDAGSDTKFPCYVVSKFVDGHDLTTAWKLRCPTFAEAAEWIAIVGDALHYAHRQGLVHRDIKPGNILIDSSRKPFVADFGLALREQDMGKGPRYAGTPAYMSPEQARGEGHRVDGRSDIFSLGVVLYELLVGHRPFRAASVDELLDRISSFEPRPPRQHDDRIPKELERICLKALAKRYGERYTTAKDFADELRQWITTAGAEGDLQSTRDMSVMSARAATTPPVTPAGTPATPNTAPIHTPPDSQPIRVVPKGLRAFDARDADFFLELVPGPRDREGLPETIRFWKSRLEELDSDYTFPVGLLYGPSGCGKSSLLRAGLLPRLASHAVPIIIEASAGDTEARLLRELRKRWDDLPSARAVVDFLAELRRGHGLPANQKLVLVIDQFEQWLHASRDVEHSELSRALRQCDGGRVQCLLLVRDDFWMAATRFMRELEVPLVEGHNSAAADLFDTRHARKVLAAFGRAYGALPGNSPLDADQEAFLDQAVAGLADDGKVVCVRLALFAEMVKGRPWTPDSLKAVGGAAGVGVAFLEETFSSATAPPQHRLHQVAARATLAPLLPEHGSDIKGHTRSRDELLIASGYSRRPREFDELIQILDSELRLITPTESESGAGDLPEPRGASSDPTPRSFQLTHDYLVPSLREWLTRKQRETRRGRAELCLAERAAAWTRSKQNRHLPDLWEYVGIRWFTSKKTWTGPQRQLMRAATSYHALRSGSVFLAFTIVLLVLSIGGPLIALRESQLRRDADRQKAIAEDERQTANHQRAEADRQRFAAEAQKQEANQQRIEADRQRQVAEEKEIELQVALAKEQKTLANLRTQLSHLARSHFDRSNVEFERDDPAKSMNWMLRAYEVAPDDDPIRDSARLMLGLQSRAFLWRIPQEAPIATVQLSADGRTALIGCLDKTVRLWNVFEGHTISLMRHDQAVRTAALAADGELVITGSSDGAARLWQAKTGKLLHVLRHEGVAAVRIVAMNPDGRTAVSGGADKTARVWDVISGKQLAILPHDDGWVETIAFSGDGRFVLTGGETTARLWEVATGKEIVALHHESNIKSIALDPGGQWAATAGRDNAARLWQIPSGIQVATLSHDDSLTGVVFSPDRERVLTGSKDQTARLWELPTGKLLRTLRHDGTVLAVAFSPDGRRVLTGSSDKTARLWDSGTGRLLAMYRHEGEVQRLEFGPSGHTVLTGSTDGAIRAWRVPNIGSPLPTQSVATIARFSPDSRKLVIGSRSVGVTTSIWNVGIRQPVIRLSDADYFIEAIAIRGDTIITCSRGLIRSNIQARITDCTVTEWDIHSGKQLSSRNLHQGFVDFVGFSNDARLLFAVDSGKTAFIWEVSTGKQLQKLTHEQGLTVAAFSDDGKRFLTGHVDKTARLWDTATGELLGSLSHDATVSAVAFNPRGDRYTTVSGNRLVNIWEAGSSRPLAQLSHDGSIRTVRFSDDGGKLLTAGSDNTVRVWDALTGAQLAKLTHRRNVNSASFSPDSQLVVTLSDDNAAALWDAGTGRQLVQILDPSMRDQGSYRIHTATFSPDGKHVLLMIAGSVILRENILAVPDEPARLRAWLTARTGKFFDATGNLSDAGAEDRRRAKNELESLGGDIDMGITTQEWHYSQAADAEQSSKWFSAAFHLNRLIEMDAKSIDLLVRRSRVFEELKDVERACADLARAADLEPANSRPVLLRGHIYARSSRWDEAIADFDAAELKTPDATTSWFGSLALIGRSDVEPFRQRFQHLFQQHCQTTDPAVAWRIATLGVLLSDAGGRSEELVKLAELAGTKYLAVAVLSGAHYRAGRYQDVINVQVGSIPLESERALTSVFRAMALRQLGRGDQARKVLNEVNAAFATAKSESRVSSEWRWYDKVQAQWLIQEAEKLIGSPGVPKQ